MRRKNPLRDCGLLGTYADAPGHTIEIGADNGRFAVVGEAKYPLRNAGVDEFSAIGGQLVTFPRDANGRVTGYEQDGKFHPRISSAITPEAAALARPRPAGQDSPADYRYRPPADFHDGIAIGDIARSNLLSGPVAVTSYSALDGFGWQVKAALRPQEGTLNDWIRHTSDTRASIQ